jgi:hypothetical protein
MLENGTHATTAEIAAAEKINESYIGRVLRLTLLAPEDRRGDPGWTAAGAPAAGGPAEAVSDGVAGSSGGDSPLCSTELSDLNATAFSRRI